MEKRTMTLEQKLARLKRRQAQLKNAIVLLDDMEHWISGWIKNIEAVTSDSHKQAT